MSRPSTRRALVRGGSFLLGLALNAALLVLIARVDTPARPVDALAPSIVPVDLSQLVLPPRAAPPRPRKLVPTAFPAKAPRRVSPAAAAPTPIAPPEPAMAPTVAPTVAAPVGPELPLSVPSASDAATRAKVSAALRGLTGCSMISGPDDDTTRERCQRAFTQADVAGVAIDAVPDEKRVGYDRAAAKAQDRRTVTAEGVAARLGADPAVRDKGRSIKIHYGCWMKFGAGAVPKMHCPGVM